MTTATATRYEIDVEDVEYIRHGSKPFLARVYKPRGTGPFPLIIDLHGGAWTKKDRLSDVATCEGLAKAGIVAVALDFRMPPADPPYPAMLQDVNYAIRWCKARAAELKTSPDKIGVLGVSSGGQTAMLTAMRPADPRYAALPLPGGAAFDASVRCAVMCWPVIDPLGRYEYAKQKKAAGDAKQADEGWRATPAGVVCGECTTCFHHPVTSCHPSSRGGELQFCTSFGAPRRRQQHDHVQTLHHRPPPHGVRGPLFRGARGIPDTRSGR